MVLVLLLAGCGELELDAPAAHAWVVYDPGEGRIPLPNDAVRDADAQRLALPIDEEMSAAEQAVRASMNEQDGWSTVSTLSFEVSSLAESADGISAGAVSGGAASGSRTQRSEAQVRPALQVPFG